MTARVCFFLCCSLRLLPGAEWTKVTSANFELYTTSSEREARQTLETFEQVRDFFMRVKSANFTTRLPVTIVGFRNLKEYKPYTAYEVAAAYYTGDEQHDYIVMSDLSAESTPVAIHEYMHLLIRHTGLMMPIWLNEGMADLYSTLRPVGGEIVLGQVPKGRAITLAQQKWMPLNALFQVDHSSREFHERDRAGIFYAQSWLVSHMLNMSPEYRDKFPAFLTQVSSGVSAESAFSRVYGKSLVQVNKDLDAYYHQNSVTGVVFKEGFRKIEISPGKPATELESGLILASLVSLLGRKEEAASRLQQLAAAHQDSYEVEDALAYNEWRKGNRPGALEHFRLALAHGDTSWKTNWDFARLAGSAPNAGDQPLDALRKTLAAKPDMLEARLMLGGALYLRKSYAQALVQLRQVKTIDAEHAHGLFLTMAYCAMRLKMETDALEYAQQAKKYARVPNEIANADRLLRYVQQKDAPSAATDQVIAGADDIRPVLKRLETETEAPQEPTRTTTLTVTGRLTQLDCLDGSARMHVTSGSTTYTLLIRQPDKIVINRGAAAVDMTCGPQDKPVTVSYREAADEKYGTTGEVVEIELSK